MGALQKAAAAMFLNLPRCSDPDTRESLPGIWVLGNFKASGEAAMHFKGPNMPGPRDWVTFFPNMEVQLPGACLVFKGAGHCEPEIGKRLPDFVSSSYIPGHPWKCPWKQYLPQLYVPLHCSGHGQLRAPPSYAELAASNWVHVHETLNTQ